MTFIDEDTRELSVKFEELREQIVAARKRIPREEVDNYSFETASGPVSLSEMFGDKWDLIIIHNMGRSCPYCTLWADGINGLVPHLENRTALYLVNSDSPEVQKEFSDSRGWRYKMASARNNTFTEDMGFWKKEEGFWPGFSTFHREPDGTIVRVTFDYFGPGDVYCPVWPMMDLLKDGSNGWEPKYKY